ncbi:MAG: 50S ribosomal protein L3 [Candidatus Jacksonbacteria bacterium]
MKFILGKKINMTQIFAGDGKVIPVTLIKAGPCYITQIKKNDEKDGYAAIQIGFEETTEKRLTKPERGHLKKVEKNLRVLREFKVSARGGSAFGGKSESSNMAGEKLKIGDKITVDTFETGDIVQVTGISKGKGFQGVVKRHGFHGSPATHGHKDQLRMPGSIGATDPQRVFPGKRMAGHMGFDQVTIKNLKVVKVDAEKNELYLRGAVPGHRGTLLKIYSQ